MSRESRQTLNNVAERACLDFLGRACLDSSGRACPDPMGRACPDPMGRACPDPMGIERIALEYTPLVKAAAARYQGRGAEYEDLVQEGYMALVILVPQCRDRRWLPLFLRNRVPYHVRDAAARLRRGAASGGETPLEVIEETAGAEDEKYGEAELRETLRRTLTRSELDITQALMEGFTQTEIARELGISQQAVAARLKKIRNKLRPLTGLDKSKCKED